MAIVGSRLAKLLGQAQCTQPTCSECPSIDNCSYLQFGMEKAKVSKVKANIPMVSFSIPNNPSSFSTWEKQNNCLVNILDTPTGYWEEVRKQEQKQVQEKECAMRATIEATMDSSLGYISNRLNSILWEKGSEIDEKFEAPTPKNVKQAKEWLKEGNYRIELPDYYNEDAASFYLAMEYLAWGKTGPDLKAKAAAKESLRKEFQAAKDTVAILSDEQARLKALREFESYSVQ